MVENAFPLYSMIARMQTDLDFICGNRRREAVGASAKSSRPCGRGYGAGVWLEACWF